MSFKFSGILIAVLGVLSAGEAAAADTQGGNYRSMDHQNNANGVINVSGFEIKPTVTLAIGKNDNVGLSNGVSPKTNTNFTILSPKVSIEMPTHGNVYSATYSGAYANYSGDSQDNYNNHNVNLAAKNDWSSRVNTLLKAEYIKGHNNRNALPTGNSSKELWHTAGVKGRLHYGADGAQGQFELSAGQQSKRYDTNASGFTQNLAYDSTPLQATFFYKVAPATNMILQASTTSFKYQAATAQQWNSKQQQYMVGVKWDATAKTSGSFKIGQVSKSFDSGLYAKKSGAAWNVAVAWSPRTYSVVNFSLSQKASESFNTGSFMIARDSKIDWRHEWSGRIKSNLMFDDGTNTFQATNQINKRQTYSAKLSYAVNRWLNAGLEYKNTRRNSTNALYNYTQSVYMLILKGTL